MKKSIIPLLIVLLVFGFTEKPKDLKIEWVENPEGDFSFYPKQTMNCEAWCYEFAGSTKLQAIRFNKDSVECRTFPDAATHSTLHFYLVNDVVKNARIELNSIVDGKSTYGCNGGTIKIDHKLMGKNKLKAVFDFTFEHPENPGKPMYWKGLIYTKIKD
jgi:hypothetical protein